MRHLGPEQRARSTWKALLALGVSLLACAIGCTPEVKADPTRRAVPVSVQLAKTSDVPLRLTVIGNVLPIATISVRSRIDGQVERVFFGEGQFVKKGEPLFQIDPRPYRVALAQARANLARDTAQARNAELEAKRAAALIKDKLVSQQEYDQKATAALTLNAAVLGDQAQVDSAQVNLDYTAIASPIAGRTGALQVAAGNLVKANGDPALVVIRQISPIYVQFTAPAENLPDIRRYSAQGALKVQVTPSAGKASTPRDGQLTFIDNTVDVATGTITMKATLANEDGELWPGQFARVDLFLSQLEGAVVVPARAVQSGQQGDHVFVVSSDLKVQSRAVTTGARFGELVVIENGIAAGEQIVTDGQLSLVPGTKVEIKASVERPEGAGT